MEKIKNFNWWLFKKWWWYLYFAPAVLMIFGIYDFVSFLVVAVINAVWVLPFVLIKPKNKEISKPSKASSYNIHSKVVGVTYCNEDGRSRQDIIKDECMYTELLKLQPYQYEGNNAIKVLSLLDNQIGFIKKELAEDIYYIVENGCVTCTITEITGGVEDKSYGVNILLTIAS